MGTRTLGPGLAYDTRNDLPEAVRVQVIALLNQRLADAIDLDTQTKQAHWNVKGPNFSALHLLFDAIHESVEDLPVRVRSYAARDDHDIVVVIVRPVGEDLVPGDHPVCITHGDRRLRRLRRPAAVPRPFAGVPLEGVVEVVGGERWARKQAALELAA